MNPLKHALRPMAVRPYRFALAACLSGVAAMKATADESKVAVTFSGGHRTEGKDKGRPVVMIAAALGVRPEVFREAFGGITPAEGGRPTREEATKNKEALMKVLKPHGVTNTRLDEVSDHYRYRPGRDELWKHTPAKAYAVVEDGKVKKVVLTDAGSGYSSTPTATANGVKLKVTVKYGKDLNTNGSVEATASRSEASRLRNSPERGLNPPEVGIGGVAPRPPEGPFIFPGDGGPTGNPRPVR